METLIALLLRYFPNQAGLIDLLRYLPEGIDTVKQLGGFTQRFIEYLKQTDPLTAEQDAAFDADIEKMKTEPWWQPDA